MRLTPHSVRRSIRKSATVSAISFAPLMSGYGQLESLGPLDERVEEPAHALPRTLVHEIAGLRVESFESVGDEHLRLGQHVGRGVQQDLPQDHLPPRRSHGSRTRSHYPYRLVPKR